MKTVTVDPASELNELLNTADHEPVELVRSGVRYRLVRDDEEARSKYHLVREGEDPFANYDPERARAAMERAAGSLKGLDVEKFLAQIKEEREQDSYGRPKR
jgi:hypothetical protein